MSIKKLTLEKQCQELDLQLSVLNMRYQNRPEDAVLEHFRSYGCIGTANEGSMMQNVLKALMLDKLTEYNSLNCKHDACTRFLEAQITINQEYITEIINSIQKTSRKSFEKNLYDIISTINLELPSMKHGLSLEVGLALFDAITTETFINLARMFSIDPYGYRKGWPDLTLVKDATVKFIEVKTTDKLHESQLKTIPMLIDIFGRNISVLKVVNTI